MADFHGCAARLDDLDRVEQALIDAADAAGATVLNMQLHHFGSGQGVTGVALLAKFHISIHTWPEHRYAALDLFLCGNSHDIDAVLKLLDLAFEPTEVRTQTTARGFGTAAYAY